MREPRNSNIRKQALLEPFDVMKFGSEDDPCFGKHYDLSAAECQECGDQEICGISFMGRLKRKRLEMEKERPVKDLEIDKLELRKEVRDFVKDKISKGFSIGRTLRLARNKFKINTVKIKSWTAEILKKK